MGMIFKHTALTGMGTGKGLGIGKLPDIEYDGYPVTPSDTVDLPNGICDAIYVTTGGNVAGQLVRADASGNVTVLATSTLSTIPSGEILPVALSRILATGTTAATVYALYRRGR